MECWRTMSDFFTNSSKIFFPPGFPTLKVIPFDFAPPSCKKESHHQALAVPKTCPGLLLDPYPDHLYAHVSEEHARAGLKPRKIKNSYAC